MIRSRLVVPVLVFSAALLLGVRTAQAQTDYHNLDDGRPVATEDAYPVEQGGIELLLPYSFERSSGATAHLVTPALELGAWRNTELDLASPFGWEAGSSEWFGARLGLLYNLNTDGSGLPAISFRVDGAALPDGTGSTGLRVTVKAIATRSWGRTRLHLNLARSVGSDRGALRADFPARWQGSAALDWTAWRESLLFVVEGGALQPVEEGPAESFAGAGLRWQWAPTLVLDLGVRRRLSATGPDLGVTVGLSHAFGWNALLPGGAR